jgi:NADH dehydrogenase [ubiquinone] 1 alpha subcomplex assembly factor 7
MSLTASLKDRLRAEIAQSGPISVADYMARCLHDPQDGYYAIRPALGADGDFITAPMVSQMFGELIGLWAVETWTRMGRPAAFVLAEMGPGDGTLMSDALRAARLAPDFLAAARLCLVETSAPLRELQAGKLADGPLTASWTDRLEQLPDGPLILIANELLDCLPAKQFVRVRSGWAERRVGLDDKGALIFGLTPTMARPGLPEDADEGSLWELSSAQQTLGAAIGARISGQGGAALLIDYGRDAPGPGDTLQALVRHRKVDPLACPGEADLTVWADFPAVLQAARDAGGETAGPLPQGDFLQRLGLGQRVAALTRSRPGLAETLERQRARLAEPDQMGTLFKACAVHSPGLIPPGFDETPDD